MSAENPLLNNVPLHPALQAQATTHRRLLRGMSLLLFVTLSGTMMVSMTRAFTSGEIANVLLLAVIGVIMLPVVALLGGLIWYLDRWQSQRLSVANRLLGECPPVMVRLTRTGPADRIGILTMIQPLAEPSAPPCYALIHPTFRASRLLRQAITAQFYSHNQQPGSDVVAIHAGDALLGRLVDKEVYCRRRRQMLMAGLVLLLLVAAVLGARAMLGG